VTSHRKPKLLMTMTSLSAQRHTRTVNTLPRESPIHEGTNACLRGCRDRNSGYPGVHSAEAVEGKCAERLALYRAASPSERESVPLAHYPAKSVRTHFPASSRRFSICCVPAAIGPFGSNRRYSLNSLSAALLSPLCKAMFPRMT
jgi:hypothetical protein